MKIEISSFCKKNIDLGKMQEVNYIIIEEGDNQIKLPIDRSYSYNDIMEELKRFRDKLIDYKDKKFNISISAK